MYNYKLYKYALYYISIPFNKWDIKYVFSHVQITI